jgi:curved DNA-binding protein CbpA
VPRSSPLDAKPQNHYETLGLWRDASDTDIRRAYRRLALRHHPDVSPESDAAERFRAIQEAYDVLVDPAARASFDASQGVDVGFGRARPRASHNTGAGSGRRAPPRRGDGVPDGWTPTEVNDWNVEAWLKANSTPLSESLRALAAEAGRSWKALGVFSVLLALAMAVCALIDGIPGVGAVVAASLLPSAFVFLFIFLLNRTT